MNGIIILCLKKPAYAMGAYNLALSIKYFNPTLHITLVSDGEHKKHYREEHYAPFDEIKQINLCDYTDGNMKFQPALAKINIYKYSDYTNTLYIDADSLVLRDIQPLLASLINSNKIFVSNKMGHGGKTEDISYNLWATNEQIWDYFKLEDDAKIHTINSSWFFFTKKATKFFKKTLNNINAGFKEEDLKTKWGNSLPDELFFVGTLAQMGVDPTFPIEVMFFGNSIDSRTLTQLTEDYFAFTLYGGNNTVRDTYITWYDRLMFKYCESYFIEHRFKAYGILVGKHVNK